MFLLANKYLLQKVFSVLLIKPKQLFCR